MLYNFHILFACTLNQEKLENPNEQIYNNDLKSIIDYLLKKIINCPKNTNSKQKIH